MVAASACASGSAQRSRHARPWIEAVGYVGPDRRRFNSTDYAGPRKRKQDAGNTVPTQVATKDQAMRILASALTQFNADPAQAVRAIREQSRILKKLAVEQGDAALAIAAAGLDTELDLGRVSLQELMGPVKTVLAQAAPETVVRAG